MVTVKETLDAEGKYAIKDIKYRMGNVREEFANAELAVARMHDIFYGKSRILPADVAARVGEIGAKTLGINDFRKESDELVAKVGSLKGYVDCVEKMLTDAEKLLDVEYDEWKDNSIDSTRQYAKELKNSKSKRGEVVENASKASYRINALHGSLRRVEEMLNWERGERDAIVAARGEILEGEWAMDDLHYVVQALGTAVEHAVEIFDWR